jgi:hypothetical protein
VAGESEVAKVATYPERQAARKGVRSWSPLRWVVIAALVAAIVVAVVLLLTYTGGGGPGGGGGGY